VTDDGDHDVETLLEGLWSVPVGRRWLLKAGLGSVVGLYGAPVAFAAGRAAVRGSQTETLQFALGAADGVSELVLVANGVRHALRRHGRASRAALRARGGLWRVLDLGALTHYAEGVSLPTGRGMLISVLGRRGGREVLVCEVWHAPAHATLALARVAHRLTGSYEHVGGSARRLAELGLTKGVIRTPAEVVQLDRIGDSYQTATGLTMSHPQVSTVDPMASAVTKEVLNDTAPVQDLGSYIGQMQRGGRDFATMEPVLDADGSPSQIMVGDMTTTFSTVRLNDTDHGFQSNLRGSVTGGISAVRDTDGLGAVIDKPLDEDKDASTATWVQPEGILPRATAYSQQLKTRASVDIKVKNPGFLFGTKTEVNGAYKDGKVPLKLSNNFVRWIWVYVQYLGPADKNLSADPNASFPDTKYSKFVAIVPQVQTVLGIPLWDKNTAEVSLEFPSGAHTARLLFCGLGSDIYGGGWRQYFPAGAYPNTIAPTDEVLVAALTTGIMCIGLPALALTADIATGKAWKAYRENVLGSSMLLSARIAMRSLRPLFEATLGLNIVEAFTTLVASGGATYVDVKNHGGDLDNLWKLLLGFATIVPKLLFSPKVAAPWVKVATSLVEEASRGKIYAALPFVGQVVAVASAVGDVATLAEVGAETTVCPWVIENEIGLTYRASVSVARDARASTFPVTARSWRLEAVVDGAVALEPITGQVNEGGRIRSDALVLDVTAPFGGKLIQWSVVFLDGGGRQVATGVSGEYKNDDPEHPPSKVEFAIVQLPAVITATTVFDRADTTAYDAQAGGYTWSDQVVVSATARDSGIQEVTGTAVATLAGFAGIVWKENDRYYLRGVPLAQNQSTFKMHTAPREGYARRPFLLLDSFVDKQDQGNHVLVEPDETSSGYHVRKVSFDPETGALTWDTKLSYGMFVQPVSACALHSSGYVVAVNTDNGRLSWLKPVDAGTDRPQLAAYAAGPGTQVGLLSSPIALAVTNPGNVLVLEAAAQQVSAFDLNGNPVRYFNGGADFTVALVSDGTYLDIAVDGASQIYVLYFTGDGASPDDYRVDVYTPAGTPLDTDSPGVNIPHLAVDYWRSVYGANYAPLSLLGTSTPHIDPDLNAAEPSLSRFDPTQAI